MLQNYYLHINYIFLLQHSNFHIQSQKLLNNFQLIYYLKPLYNHYYIFHNIFEDSLYYIKHNNEFH